MVYSQPSSASSQSPAAASLREARLGNNDNTVHFDEIGALRILPQEQGHQAEALQNNARGFEQNLTSSMSLLQTALDVVSAKIALLETQKAKVIGLRNKVASETDQRHHMMRRYKQRIQEKQDELDRTTAQIESLRKVHLEQEAMIDQLLGS